eukprot:1151602-Pelagomonas_calceolata.AAC.1
MTGFGMFAPVLTQEKKNYIGRENGWLDFSRKGETGPSWLFLALLTKKGVLFLSGIRVNSVAPGTVYTPFIPATFPKLFGGVGTDAWSSDRIVPEGNPGLLPASDHPKRVSTLGHFSSPIYVLVNTMYYANILHIRKKGRSQKLMFWALFILNFLQGFSAKWPSAHVLDPRHT